MICKNCGANNDSNNSFCSNCGMPLTNSEPINNQSNLTNNINSTVNSELINNQSNLNNNINPAVNSEPISNQSNLNNNINNYNINNNINSPINNEVNKKNNKILFIIIGIVVLVVIIVIVVLVFKNVINNKQNSNAIDKNNPKDVNNLVKKDIESYIANGYKELDISEIPKSDKLSTFSDDDERVFIVNDNESKNIFKLIISVENGVGYFGDENNKTKFNVDNIDKIYVTSGQNCSTDLKMFILTKNGDLYNTNYFWSIYDAYSYIQDQGKEYANSFKKYNSNYKFQNIYELKLDSSVCNKKYLNVFETTDNQKILESGLNYNDIAHNIGTYIITKDNYVYNAQTNKLLHNSKVKTILYNKVSERQTNYIIYLEDNHSIVIIK